MSLSRRQFISLIAPVSAAAGLLPTVARSKWRVSNSKDVEESLSHWASLARWRRYQGSVTSGPYFDQSRRKLALYYVRQYYQHTGRVPEGMHLVRATMSKSPENEIQLSFGGDSHYQTEMIVYPKLRPPMSA